MVDMSSIICVRTVASATSNVPSNSVSRSNPCAVSSILSKTGFSSALVSAVFKRSLTSINTAS